MSVIKLFVLSLMMFSLSFCGSKYMESTSKDVKYAGSSDYANKDAPYKFTVDSDGQMIRLEFSGTAPMNKWYAFDMEVYSANERYLFSYQDDLWSESGHDSDGAWTERKRHAYLDVRFPQQGEYLIYLTDSSNSRSGNMNYSFRAVPINGNGKAFKPLMLIFGVIGFACFLILAHKLENQSKKPMGYGKSSLAKPKNKSNTWVYVFGGAFVIWFAVFLTAYDDDDDIDINTYYLSHSYKSNSIYVDRSLRQQSLSGSNFRAGSGRGGK